MSVQARDAFGILHEVSGYANIDSVLSTTSKNPVSNKTITNALALKIDKTVTDLVNYYAKSDVYNKAETRELLGALNTLTIAVVPSLPTSDISTTTIYFVGPVNDTYEEYVYVNDDWVKIGDTDIDLTDYVTQDQLTTALQDYCSLAEVQALLVNYYEKNQVDAELAKKQDTLTFDTTPAAGSANPVTSAGIKAALDTKQDILTFDTTPTSESLKAVTSNGIYEAFTVNNTTLKDVAPVLNSVKPITSGGVYNALSTKQNTLTFDTVPTAGSSNPVTSAGIKGYVDSKSGSASTQIYHTENDKAGHLVKTNLYYKGGSDFFLEMGYFTYGGQIPAKLILQGYCYTSGVIQCGALWIGIGGPKITLYEMSDGYVAFWIPKWSYWTGPVIQNGQNWPKSVTFTVTNPVSKPSSGYIRMLDIPTYRTSTVQIS